MDLNNQPDRSACQPTPEELLKLFRPNLRLSRALYANRLVHAHRERAPTVPSSDRPQVGSVLLRIPVSLRLGSASPASLQIRAEHDPDRRDPGSAKCHLRAPGGRSTGRSGRGRYQSCFYSDSFRSNLRAEPERYHRRRTLSSSKLEEKWACCRASDARGP